MLQSNSLKSKIVVRRLPLAHDSSRPSLRILSFAGPHVTEVLPPYNNKRSRASAATRGVAAGLYYVMYGVLYHMIVYTFIML